MKITLRQAPIVAVRAGIAASVLLTAMCLMFLIEPDTRSMLISSLAPETRLVGLPAGLRAALAMLIVINFPAAVAVQVLIWILDFTVPSLSPFVRAWIVGPSAIAFSILWWTALSRKVHESALE